MRQRCLHGEEDRGQIGADDGFELFERGLAERRCAADAGIGEDNVKIAKLFSRFSESFLRGCNIGHVDLQRQHVATKSFDGGGKGLWIAAGNGDLGAFVDEDAGGGKADAAVSAGDDGNFVLDDARS